jgi:DNA-binding response OmpR family regulator
MRLLLVEDDLVLANGLRVALQNEGYVVDHLATGGDVVKQLTRSLVDLIITTTLS